MADLDLESWYRQYGEAIHRRCLRLLKDEVLAMDVTQDTFLRASVYRSSFRGQSPLSWLLTIADRRCLDVLRRQPVWPTHAELQAFLETEDEGSGHCDWVDHHVIARLLTRSDEQTQRMVLHRYVDELGLEEIAERLGVNERTVRRRLERFLEGARKSLKRAG